MKIIQVISNISGTGATAYLMTLHRALRDQGHDVAIYQFSNMEALSFGSDDINMVHKEFNEETYAELNAADMIFVEGLPHKKESQEYKDAYCDMLQYYVKTIKTLFIHSHIYVSWAHANYTKRVASKEFLLSMDKICSFSIESNTIKKFASIIGQDEIEKRFIRMFHPHVFSKDLWIPANEKTKKVSYFGRLVRLKDPERLIEMRDPLWDNGWQIEMRGVVRSIGALGFKNLCFKWNEETNEPTQEKSDVTCFLTGKLKEEYGLDKKDEICNDLNTTERKIFVFGRYKLEDGLNVMSRQSFGVDFYNLSTQIYGDAVEYAIYDIVNCGTIPLLDEDMAKRVHVFVDGECIDKTLYSENAGIFVKSDLSNVNEAIEKMNKLYENPYEYERYRTNCYNIYKQLADPKWIIKRLVNDVLS